MSGLLSKAARDKANQPGDHAREAIKEVQREPMSRLNVELPQSLYRELKSRAAADGEKVSDLVRKWVNEYLSKNTFE